jgi:hypothetical protein
LAALTLGAGFAGGFLALVLVEPDVFRETDERDLAGVAARRAAP